MPRKVSSLAPAASSSTNWRTSMGTSLSPSSGRQPSSGSGAPRFKSAVPEINITPLVDVVLVLLIIFMVIAPALEHGERVELPAVKNDDKTDKGKMDPVTVTMGASGALFLEKEAVALTALPARVRSIHEREPNRKLSPRGHEPPLRKDSPGVRAHPGRTVAYPVCARRLEAKERPERPHHEGKLRKWACRPATATARARHRK
ncbi:MAG: biopolymer transporter ExbD [Polyangiaceae bacterium]